MATKGTDRHLTPISTPADISAIFSISVIRGIICSLAMGKTKPDQEAIKPLVQYSNEKYPNSRIFLSFHTSHTANL